ncbi:hypothetical protein FP744_10005985 [Trichoderma asperellum]|nr:hypothetical protein LI328DRAFT_138383 [Trichoderma asperelloides]
MRSSVYAQGAVAFFSLFTLGSAAADCYSHDDASIPSFSVADGRKLQNEIAGNKFDPQLEFPFLIEASHTASFSMGSARACLANTYSWQYTHIDQNDLRFAVQSILDECDRNDGTSKGGKIQVTGDTGLVLDVFVKDVALEC